jgi:hypothetical protein
MTNPQPLAAWLAARTPEVIRSWAERTGAGEPVTVIPNAVIAFATRHQISLADPRRAGAAILRTLTAIDAARKVAP